LVKSDIQAYYIFANKAGTELVVIRKTTTGNTWSLEFMPVNE